MKEIQKHIAVCSNIRETWEGRLFRPEIASKFIGCGWASHLKQIWKKGDVVTGDVAAREIAANRWDASSVLIIQSEESKAGRLLERQGCGRFLYICWESPLYAFKTYDTFRNRSENYRFGSHAQWHKDEGVSAAITTKPFYFPCLQGSQADWRRSTRITISDIPRKAKVALVASYKPLRSEFRRCITEKDWGSTHLGLVTDLRRLKSTTYRQAVIRHTHEMRMKLLRLLVEQDLIDIYGSNWTIHNHGPCKDKTQTLESYALAIALENCIWPGYHTEKIPQAIYAGAIPIADLDDVTKRAMPRDCFIDIQGLTPRESVQLIESTLQSPSRLTHLREAGRDYLCRAKSRLYFEKDFAIEVAEKALTYLSEQN